MANERLRVAMLSYHTCPLAILGGKDTGGMNVYVRELTRHLGRKGVHVDVYTRSQDEHVPHVIHDLGYGNRVVHVPAGPELPLPKEALQGHLPAFSDWILQFSDAKGLEYDLIHSHYWLSGLAALTLKERWGVPVVHMSHTLGLLKNRIAGEGEYEGNYRIEGEMRILQEADAIVAATSTEKSQLEELYQTAPEKIHVIPPGVNLGHFYPIPKDEAREYTGLAEDERLVLFVGRIEPLKGIETLMRALAKMRELGVLRRHKVRLAIIGGDATVSEAEMSAEMARLHGLREELGLGDMITFLGKQGQDQLPYYYSASDVVVLPSRYESFGMVVLEAMASGTPVVASQVGGLLHLVEHGETGYLIADQDETALCERLSELLDDEELLYRMGTQAEQASKRFDWLLITDQMLKLYQQVEAGEKTGAARGR